MPVCLDDGCVASWRPLGSPGPLVRNTQMFFHKLVDMPKNVPPHSTEKQHCKHLVVRNDQQVRRRINSTDDVTKRDPLYTMKALRKSVYTLNDLPRNTPASPNNVSGCLVPLVPTKRKLNPLLKPEPCATPRRHKS